MPSFSRAQNNSFRRRGRLSQGQGRGRRPPSRDRISGERRRSAAAGIEADGRQFLRHCHAGEPI